MQRPGGTSANLRLPWRALAGIALLAATGTCAWIGWKLAADERLGAVDIVAPIVLLATAGAAGVAGTRARALAERQDLARALRDARDRLQCLDDVLDVWQWRSDHNHRLVELRPPHGASTADWRPPASAAAVWDVFRCDDEPALRARMAAGAPLDDVEVGRAGLDADWRGILRARPCRDPLGEFAGYRGIAREAAPPAVAATDVERSPSAAEAAGAEQESFNYTVSHDLRAPIRVVEGFTKIVKEDYGRLLDRVGNDHLDRVLGAAARMNNMIDALLALSRLASQPLARQPVNLSQLAGYVTDELRRQAPDRNVAVTIEPGLRIQGDPTLLRVVLENLLGNAWKYTAKTSQGQIVLERHAGAADTFTVRDNGAGFDMRFADRLFGVFQRLHSANDFSGTGVGLASVRRIIRRHGGEIWGEAEVNRGARFHFSLPQSAAPQSAAPLRAGAPAAPLPQPPAGEPPIAAPSLQRSLAASRSQSVGAPASSASSSRNA